LYDPRLMKGPIAPLLALTLLSLAAFSCAREEPAPSARPAAAARARPSAPAAALSKEDVTREGRQAWRRALPWPGECEEAFAAADPAHGGVTFHELARGRYLVQVDCAPGAYQGSQVYLLYDETRRPPAARLLTFRFPSSPDGERLEWSETAEVWGTPELNRAEGELTIFNKSRGPGDCGILVAYDFADGLPVLRELRAKLACDGRLANQPERWDEVPLR
jgi:hypothetical protein